jgi:hypothetical protein
LDPTELENIRLIIRQAYICRKKYEIIKISLI